MKNLSRFEGDIAFTLAEPARCINLAVLMCSPEEAAQIFEAHLITSKDFAASAPQMLSSSDLVCRVGGFLYPWRTAAPLVLGALAFGGSWESLLPEGSAGIKVALPPGIGPPQEMADVRKVSPLCPWIMASRISLVTGFYSRTWGVSCNRILKITDILH